MNYNTHLDFFPVTIAISPVQLEARRLPRRLVMMVMLMMMMIVVMMVRRRLLVVLVVLVVVHLGADLADARPARGQQRARRRYLAHLSVHKMDIGE